MGPNEPFWRTNSSFSPPLSRRWDYQLQSDDLPYEPNGDGVIALYDSSLSTDSKESRSWVNGEQVLENQYSPSDSSFSYFNSPDSFQNQQLMPPPVQGVNINDYVRESLSDPRTSSRFAEGTSRAIESVGSLSSRSDDSEYEPTSRTHSSSHRSFSSCCSFMSKPVHPFSFPEYTDEGEESYGAFYPSNFNNTPHSDTTSAQSFMDLTDMSRPLEAESFGLPHKNRNSSSRCGLCERLLSQRSLWGSRRMVWSGDMPMASVLSCSHVYHAECLERITPKPQNHDPPCPICEKLENGYGVEKWAICRLKNGLPRLRSLGEEGPSRVWSCGQAGDCVDGAVDSPKWSSSMLLRNRSHMKRQLSLKGNSGKERAENSKRSGLCSPRVSLGAVGCSSPEVKRW